MPESGKEMGLYIMPMERLRKSYKFLLISIIGFTGLAVGGKYLHEWLTPKPEPALSADLTKQYAHLFQRLDIREIKNGTNFCCDAPTRHTIIKRAQKEALVLDSAKCDGSMPEHPVTFEVTLDHGVILAFPEVDKGQFTYREYHDAVSSCLNQAIAEVQHTDAAHASWRQR